MMLVLFAFFSIVAFIAVFFQESTVSLATGENMVAVGALALFLGIPVKGIVDIVKGATGASGGKLPVIGVAVGTLLALLVQIASGTSLSTMIAAQCFFAGLMAQLAAMASTGLQTKMEDARDKMPETKTN